MQSINNRDIEDQQLLDPFFSFLIDIFTNFLFYFRNLYHSSHTPSQNTLDSSLVIPEIPSWVDHTLKFLEDAL